MVLSVWSNFYVIAGSSAAALTGLTFIVITLISGRRAAVAQEGIAAFSTPTVIHFCTALLVSAIASAPWHELRTPSILFAVTAAYGVVNCAMVIARFMPRHVGDYEPDVSDWIWHAMIPFVAYAIMLGTAIRLPAAPHGLFLIGGATMTLIFVGIRNAWDVVTYITIAGAQDENDS